MIDTNPDQFQTWIDDNDNEFEIVGIEHYAGVTDYVCEYDDDERAYYVEQEFEQFEYVG